MAQTEFWSTLVTAIDPGNNKAMPAVLQSTIDLLETELVKAKAALQEIQPHVAATAIQRDELVIGAMTAYRQHLITRAPDFYGSRRLSAKEIGLVPVVQEVASDSEDSDVEQPPCTVTVMPPKQASLVDVLSNGLILDHMAPYLGASSLLALSSTSRFIRSMVLDTPYVFRHLDLTQCRGAQVAPSGAAASVPIDEDVVTEDEFYAAPLRGIFDKLARRSILQGVRTLILDGLSVPADVVGDIVLSDRFNVNILSIRDCQHLNERKLMQVLQYSVRSTRPPGTPRVKAIYHFTPMESQPSAPVRPRYRDWWGSRCQSPSATPPSAESAPEPAQFQVQNAWYRPSGQLLKKNVDEEWAKTIQKCEGIIAFDTVLCRGPRHDLFSTTNQSEGRSLGPAIATVALGPQGCDGCNTCPEGPAIWGQSAFGNFPLITPVPLHSSSIKAAKRPVLYSDESPVFIARCTDCMTDRRCHRCSKWFCSDCLPQPVRIRVNLSPHQTAVQGSCSASGGISPLPEQELERGVSKDCWECGPTCMSCKIEVERKCQNCRGEYCIEHNEGCSDHMCDWCNTSARHRLRDFY